MSRTSPASVRPDRRPPSISRASHSSPARTELPTVLRLPNVDFAGTTTIAPTADTALLRFATNERVFLIVVAGGLVLLALLLFRSGPKKTDPTVTAPVIEAPPAVAAPMAVHQPVPTWNEPMSTDSNQTLADQTPQPPIAPASEPWPRNPSGGVAPFAWTQNPGDRYATQSNPEVRTADAGASLAERARRETAPPPATGIRFEGTIAKPTPGMTYDRP